jgi:hypothetical protein
MTFPESLGAALGRSESRENRGSKEISMGRKASFSGPGRGLIELWFGKKFARIRGTELDPFDPF